LGLTIAVWFERGGIFMWPLLACVIVGLALVVERIVSFHRAKVDVRALSAVVSDHIRQGDRGGAIDACMRSRGPVAAVLRAGLLKAGRGRESVKDAIEASGAIELSFLQRGLLGLASLTQIAPLLGFLGTVSGMIHAFGAIAAADQVSAKLVASGIEEALITTEAGLCIAIPVQVAHALFVRRVDRFIIEMEEASTALVDALSERDEL
jgi:biopolymer transport protein ExbB